MKKLLTVLALLGACSGFGLAETWQGTLLDAHCTNKNTAQSCGAKTTTTSFLLDVNGTNYKLDSRSNFDASAAIQSRADKANNPDATKAVPVDAKITGYLRSNGKIHSNIIELQ